MLKYCLFFLAAVPNAVASLVERANGCNADNCLRAISGSAAGAARVSSRLQDCTSIQQVTFYPFPTLSVVVSGPTPAYTVKAQYAGDNHPTALPSYASTACKPQPTNLGDFGIELRLVSACACAGVPATTVSTASSVTETITVPTGKPQAPLSCSSPGTPNAPNYCADRSYCLCLGDVNKQNNYCILDVSDYGPTCRSDKDCKEGTFCLDPKYTGNPDGASCGTYEGYQACAAAPSPQNKKRDGDDTSVNVGAGFGAGDLKGSFRGAIGGGPRGH